MAGRPLKYVDEYYAVESKQTAENVAAGIVSTVDPETGKRKAPGRPSVTQLVAILTARGDSFDASWSSDRLSETLRKSRAMELESVRELRKPEGIQTPSKPPSQRGFVIASNRYVREREETGRKLFESMFSKPEPEKPKRTRKPKAAVTA